MQSERIRHVVEQAFTSSLSQSQVDISALPPEQLGALKRAIADSIFAVLDEVEGDDYIAPSNMASARVAPAAASLQQPAAASAPMNEDESLLWKGRPYLSIGLRFELTTERLRIFRGLLGHSLEEIELVRVRDTKVKQHLGERTLNVGDITIYSNDPTTPETILNNVKNPLEVREMIRKATIEEKERRGLHYREEM